MLVNEWMKTMRLEFGMFEFKAISPQGHIIKSDKWIDQSYRYEVTPSDNHAKVKK